MVQPLRDDEDPPCGVCGRPAERFGRYWAQRFLSEDVEFLCIDCARATVPSKVRFAEDWDAEAGRRERNTP